MTNLREEERKLETNIQTLIAQGKEQRERLQHITIEGKRLEQELHKNSTTQPYRRYVNQRERQTPRLTDCNGCLNLRKG